VPRNWLKLFEQEVPWSAEAKYLGIHSKRRLTWKAHLNAMENKAMQPFASLYSSLKCRTLNKKLKTHLYKSFIRPILLHGTPVWGYAATSNMKKLQVIQGKIFRSIYDGDRYTSISNTSTHIELGVRILNEEIK
jgi:hypothetical protein